MGEKGKLDEENSDCYSDRYPKMIADGLKVVFKIPWNSYLKMEKKRAVFKRSVRKFSDQFESLVIT